MGILTALYQASQEWHAMRGQAEPTTPLTADDHAGSHAGGDREKAANAQGGPEHLAQARQQGCVDEQNRLVFLQWDPQKKTMVRGQSMKPIPLQEVIQDIKDMLPKITPDSMLRFHAQWPLKEQQEDGNRAVFHLSVSLRGQEANSLHQTLQKLGGNACWRAKSERTG